MNNESEKSKNAGCIVAAVIASVLGVILLLGCAGVVLLPLWARMHSSPPAQTLPQQQAQPQPAPPPIQVVPAPPLEPRPTAVPDIAPPPIGQPQDGEAPAESP
jgi:hypothetical protein